MTLYINDNDSEWNIIALKCVIICDYFLRIYKNYANLLVINGDLTIKFFFATNRVVWLNGIWEGGGTGQNLWPRIIGYRNYRVKSYLAY